MLQKNELTNLEFASGIPGALGGAITMNAGAYGGEMKDVVIWVEALDNSLNLSRYENIDMDFSYRHSIVEKQGLIVIRCAMKLAKGSTQLITIKWLKLSHLRKTKQPIHLPSAGSTFKRPEGYFAAKLIEDCGLKGFSIGAAQVSPLHCGFVVNNGEATAADIYALIKYVEAKVKEKTGVQLGTEVKIIGEF